MRIIVTGGQGFVGSYICQELLEQGHHVLSIDNLSKYGPVTRPQDFHKNFEFEKIDIVHEFIKFIDSVEIFLPDIIICCAAYVGGTQVLHEKVYDILDINNLIMANTIRVASQEFKYGELKRLVVMSSTMIYEGRPLGHVHEDDKHIVPSGVYGFQKLSCEYYAKAAFEQYGLPYTNIRISNCIGVGEDKSVNSDIKSGHVVPDLINKILVEKQDPLILLGSGEQTRCFTNGKDIARAVRIAMDHPTAFNESFNIANPQQIKIVDLARIIWNKLNPDKPFNVAFVPTYKGDPQHNHVSVHKARELLHFCAEISLEESIDEVIEYIKCQS